MVSNPGTRRLQTTNPRHTPVITSNTKAATIGASNPEDTGKKARTNGGSTKKKSRKKRFKVPKRRAKVKKFFGKAAKEVEDVKITETAAMAQACEQRSEQRCHICLELVVSGGEYHIKLPCNHEFGSACIIKWLGYRKSCPLCRFICSISGSEESVHLYEGITEASFQHGQLSIVTRGRRIQYSHLDTVEFRLNKDNTISIAFTCNKLFPFTAYPYHIQLPWSKGSPFDTFRVTAKALSIAKGTRIWHLTGVSRLRAARCSGTADTNGFYPYVFRDCLRYLIDDLLCITQCDAAAVAAEASTWMGSSRAGYFTQRKQMRCLKRLCTHVEKKRGKTRLQKHFQAVGTCEDAQAGDFWSESDWKIGLESDDESDDESDEVSDDEMDKEADTKLDKKHDTGANEE
ncbi:hypothetical protein FKW77_001239 [Venturia effusa]|uniref:RING-type domain-containing protein n=1 Tax=Venturia effusa TaxID=50376 RepID=A0A517LI23_9PEZI|nr:hypothetical protein FKW77_001239 [Venturia effusa]